MQDLLDLLKAEKEQENNKELKVDANPQLEQITRGFEKTCLWYNLLKEIKKITESRKYWIYDISLLNVPDSVDIDYIVPNSFISKKYPEHFKWNPIPFIEIITHYITALANHTKKQKVMIDLTKIDDIIINQDKRNFYHLCHHNEKEIVIFGNAGWYLGEDMVDGVITVNGEVGLYTGQNMKKGVINLNCSPGKEIDHLIDIYHPPRGEIYYNNKLICKEGKIIE